MEGVETRTERELKNIKHVYKTHYFMAEWYERIDKLMTLFVAFGTGSLAVVIIWDAANRNVLLTVALLVALVSWSDAVWDFSAKSQEHYSAADEYHDLYNQMLDFYHTSVLPGDNSDNLKKMYKEYTDSKEIIKNSTPRTTNFWFSRLNDDQIEKELENDLE